MTIKLAPGGVIELQGACPSEDAEVLVRYLLADPSAIVDWSTCTEAHSAVIQVLLVVRPPLQGVAAGQALREWVHPALSSSSSAGPVSGSGTITARTNWK